MFKPEPLVLDCPHCGRQNDCVSNAEDHSYAEAAANPNALVVLVCAQCAGVWFQHGGESRHITPEEWLDLPPDYRSAITAQVKSVQAFNRWRAGVSPKRSTPKPHPDAPDEMPTLRRPLAPVVPGMTDPATIYPTHSCFDDALDYLTGAVKQDAVWAVEHLRLVHGICLAPEGPHAGEAFAHGWVEQDARFVIQAGILNGEKGYFGCHRREHYKLLRVRLTTVYTIAEAVERNRQSNNFGPWEQVYRDLCGSGRVFQEEA